MLFYCRCDESLFAAGKLLADLAIAAFSTTFAGKVIGGRLVEITVQRTGYSQLLVWAHVNTFLVRIGVSVDRNRSFDKILSIHRSMIARMFVFVNFVYFYYLNRCNGLVW